METRFVFLLFTVGVAFAQQTPADRLAYCRLKDMSSNSAAEACHKIAQERGNASLVDSEVLARGVCVRIVPCMLQIHYRMEVHCDLPDKNSTEQQEVDCANKLRNADNGMFYNFCVGDARQPCEKYSLMHQAQHILEVKGDLSTVKSNLSTISGNLTTINNNLTAINDGIDVMKGKIDAVDAKVDKTNENLHAIAYPFVASAGVTTLCHMFGGIPAASFILALLQLGLTLAGVPYPWSQAVLVSFLCMAAAAFRYKTDPAFRKKSVRQRLEASVSGTSSSLDTSPRALLEAINNLAFDPDLSTEFAELMDGMNQLAGRKTNSHAHYLKSTILKLMPEEVADKEKPPLVFERLRSARLAKSKVAAN
jgi:hypothetical protein